jgi:hypothetical protein
MFLSAHACGEGVVEMVIPFACISVFETKSFEGIKDILIPCTYMVGTGSAPPLRGCLHFAGTWRVCVRYAYLQPIDLHQGNPDADFAHKRGKGIQHISIP